MTTIQPATLDQSATILAVLLAAFEQYRLLLDPPSGVFSETTESIRQKIEIGGGFTAWNAQEMIGVVLYQPHPDYMYLGRLGVLPAYRGQQIASQLVAAVEQAAIMRGLSVIQLGVRIALTGNQQLFERLGYHITGTHSHAGYSEITYLEMKKRLTRSS